MPRGADVAVTTPDWSIAFSVVAFPGGLTRQSSHDMEVERFVAGPGVYLLTLGSGGTDADHEEASVKFGTVPLASPPEWSLEFVDNTHRRLHVQSLGANVDPIQVNVAIRRLPLGGEP